jgi:hypothetical protein
MFRKTTHGARVTMLDGVSTVVTCALLTAGFFGITYVLEPRIGGLDSRKRFRCGADCARSIAKTPVLLLELHGTHGIANRPRTLLALAEPPAMFDVKTLPMAVCKFHSRSPVRKARACCGTSGNASRAARPQSWKSRPTGS